LTCPNVYACTKAVTEYLLQKEGAGLPLTIVRPLIVTAAIGDIILVDYVTNLVVAAAWYTTTCK
jgi:thioester reductase-like protein